MKAGLIDGSKLHVDSSLVRADASLNCVVAVTMAKLDGEEEAVSEDEPPKTKGGGPADGVNARNKVTTDPDSTLVRHRTGKSLPSYKNHRALDDKAGVITVTKTTTGIRDDGAELPALVEAHEQITKSKTRVVVGDSKYGISANFIALASLGIRSHMAICGADCATTASKASTGRNASATTRGATPSPVLRDGSYTITTIIASAAIMNTAHGREYAADAGWRTFARGPRPEERSIVILIRNCSTAPASNPAGPPPSGIANGGNGSRSATLRRRPPGMVSSGRVGAVW
jgi:hypothetical protein